MAFLKKIRLKKKVKPQQQLQPLIPDILQPDLPFDINEPKTYNHDEFCDYGVTTLCTVRSVITKYPGGEMCFTRHFCGECRHMKRNGKCKNFTVFGKKRTNTVLDDWIACEAFEAGPMSKITTELDTIFTKCEKKK